MFCVAMASTAVTGRPAPLIYTIGPVIEERGARSIQIELQFRAGAARETRLELPNEWGGKDRLYDALSDLEVRGANAQLVTGDNLESRVLHHPPNAPITLRYRVHHADEGPARTGNPYRPVIAPKRLQLLGEAFVVAPADTPMTHPVQVRFQGFPKQWALASDLEHGSLDFQSLLQSITVAGDFRVLSRLVLGMPLRVAIQGAWPFTDAQLVDNLAAISRAQHHFWGDDAQPYLVTFTQIDGATSGGGTGLGDAFAMFATADFDTRDITRALAHEMTHTWIPGRVGQLAGDQPAEALDYWFSEGFSDYYANRVLMSSGIWSPREFAASFNTAARRYASSPVRNAPNSAIGTGFWKDSSLQQLPYDRGMLFATWLDRKLRAASQGRMSLDVVMRAMHRRFERGPEPLRRAFLAEVAALGVDIHREFTDFIEAGGDVVLDADTFGPCGRVRIDELPSFHRGFDVDATMRNGMRITGVDPGLPAYSAGLRDGMTILAREAGVIGDSSQELAYRVLDSGAERVIRYLPRGHGVTRTQSLELEIGADSNAPGECRRRLGAVD
jgi:predicted metalloprotease with PDZ domain